MKDLSTDMESVLLISDQDGERFARMYARSLASMYPNEFAVRHMLFNQARYAHDQPNWLLLLSDRVAQWWAGVRV